MTYPFHISDDVAGMRKAIENHLKCTLARDARTATRQDWYLATAHAVRDRIMERYIVTMQTHANANTRRVYYLSLEYLMGRMLHNNLYNTGLFETARKALAELGLAMPEIDEEEPDMGLGNGGLGRLAACFLDSLAPAHSIESKAHALVSQAHNRHITTIRTLRGGSPHAQHLVETHQRHGFSQQSENFRISHRFDIRLAQMDHTLHGGHRNRQGIRVEFTKHHGRDGKRQR